MLRFATALLTGLLGTGCAVAPSDPRTPSTPDGLALVIDNPIAEPEPIDPALLSAAACEALLEQLQQSEQLMGRLNSQLDGHAARVEATVKSLKPAPAPAPQDCPEPAAALPEGKQLIGGLEWIYMEPPGRHYRARVDSGADTSSISASDITEFERDGDDWVRFTFQHDSPEEAVEFELPVVRTAMIRQASVKEAERRVVVEIDIRLGDQLQTTEFNLADRSEMTYPVLLGRAFLMDLYLVDVSRSYTQQRYRPARP